MAGDSESQAANLAAGDWRFRSFLRRRIEPRLIPWAWAVNGVGSVASAVLAVILGMSIGFSGVAFVALAVYALGTGALLHALRHT